MDAHPRAVEELRRLHGCCSAVLPYNALRSRDPPNTPSWAEWTAEHPAAAAALPPLHSPWPGGKGAPELEAGRARI